MNPKEFQHRFPWGLLPSSGMFSRTFGDKMHGILSYILYILLSLLVCNIINTNYKEYVYIYILYI